MFRGSKEPGEQSSVGSIVYSCEGDGIFRGGGGTDSKF